MEPTELAEAVQEGLRELQNNLDDWTTIPGGLPRNPTLLATLLLANHGILDFMGPKRTKMIATAVDTAIAIIRQTDLVLDGITDGSMDEVKRQRGGLTVDVVLGDARAMRGQFPPAAEPGDGKTLPPSGPS